MPPGPLRPNENLLLDAGAGKAVHQVDEKPLGPAVFAEVEVHYFQRSELLKG
jgi:hypothetical protein